MIAVLLKYSTWHLKEVDAEERHRGWSLGSASHTGCTCSTALYLSWKVLARSGLDPLPVEGREEGRDGMAAMSERLRVRREEEISPDSTAKATEEHSILTGPWVPVHVEFSEATFNRSDVGVREQIEVFSL